jgi:hypothetical protein
MFALDNKSILYCWTILLDYTAGQQEYTILLDYTAGQQEYTILLDYTAGLYCWTTRVYYIHKTRAFVHAVAVSAPRVG